MLFEARIRPTKWKRVLDLFIHLREKSRALREVEEFENHDGRGQPARDSHMGEGFRGPVTNMDSTISEGHRIPESTHQRQD